MPPSVFGRYAANDPRLVSDLRAGRGAGKKLTHRVEHFLIMWREKLRAGEAIRCGDRRTREGRAALSPATGASPSAARRATATTAMPPEIQHGAAYRAPVASAFLPDRRPPFVRMQGASR